MRSSDDPPASRLGSDPAGSGSTHPPARHRGPGVLGPLYLVLALGLAVLTPTLGSASEFSTLASLDGASGDEGRVISFLAERLAGAQRRGANGSLIVEFGSGRPRTLLAAGVDEPGYAVSNVNDEGYLRLHSLGGQAFKDSLARYFIARHLSVRTVKGRRFAGVTAAPSVHIGEASRYRSYDDSDLYVDVGATNPSQVRSAGIGPLSRVTIAKQARHLGPDWVTAPWISSRVGAGILLVLGQHLAAHPPSGTVILAFATQQYPGNVGFARTIESIEADRTVLLIANGEDRPAIAPIGPSDRDLVNTIQEVAKGLNLELRLRSAHRFRGMAFADPIGSHGRLATVLIPGVHNSGTPAASVDLGAMDDAAGILAALVGVPAPPPQPRGDRAKGESTASASSPRTSSDALFASALNRLSTIAGVSKNEGAVRDALIDLVPNGLRKRSQTDSKGNLVVSLGPQGPPETVFLAHMDEIGHVVKRWDSSTGTATVESVGGTSQALFEWRPVSIHTDTGSHPAVMLRDGRLWLGLPRKPSKRAWTPEPGQTVTVAKQVHSLMGKRVSGRSLDDRLGCAVLIAALARLERRASRAARSVAFVFSVEEETGLDGARHLADTWRPRRVYPVDTFVTSDTPTEDRRYAYARLGKGPVLRGLDESGVTSAEEIASTIALAKRLDIPLQIGATGGGNDGSAFVSLHTANIPIGFPLRYAHTSVETADLGDAEAAVDLIEALAIEAMGGGRSKRR